jgi:hypothetical protein
MHVDVAYPNINNNLKLWVVCSQYIKPLVLNYQTFTDDKLYNFAIPNATCYLVVKWLSSQMFCFQGMISRTSPFFATGGSITRLNEASMRTISGYRDYLACSSRTLVHVFQGHCKSKNMKPDNINISPISNEYAFGFHILNMNIC